ncbi:MAG TPA: SCO family protein [Aestuariivirgaceae bacterium]|nr:SCO family protein [Aestuariivirgaceae bacterium]
MTSFIRKRFLALVILLVAAATAGAAGYRLLTTELAPASSGTALVGGPFRLTSHTGAKVSDADFRGKFMLVFFGYTYCPDVCPSELQVISAALDTLGEAGRDIVPIFVSIDPVRDTPEVVAQYIKNFHPRFVGLTGSDAEVAAMAKAYRVYYGKAEGSGDTDYLMDHSSIVYLMDREGRFLKHFSYSTDAEALARGLKEATAGR